MIQQQHINPSGVRTAGAGFAAVASSRATSESPPTTSAVELSDDDLDAASGGLVVNAIIAVLVGTLLPSVQKDGMTPDQARQVAAGNPLPRPR